MSGKITVIFWESQWSSFWFQPVWDLCACGLKTVSISHHGLGSWLLQNNSRYASDLLYISLQEEPKICDSIVLIINCLNLLFGTWEYQGDWSYFLNKQETGDSKRLLYLLNPAWFQCPVFLDTPQSWGQQGQDNKGNKVLDREVHQKPGRGTWFLEELVSTSWNLNTVIQSYSNVSNI